MKSVLVIPTLDIELAKRCSLSFAKGVSRTSTQIIIVYNGPDDGIKSSFYGPSVAIIGAKESDGLVEKFARAANCPAELLFGERAYGRSFGGASNLVLAIGYSMNADVIFKVDDDCLDLHEGNQSWLERASRSIDRAEIRYGTYYGLESGGVHRLPRSLGLQLAKFIYSKEETEERLGDVNPAEKVVIKNGCLVFRRKGVGQICYPVLYERKSRISARGEVYCLKQELSIKGIRFLYDKTLSIQHSPVRKHSLQEWLSAMVVGFDLNLVRRSIFEECQGIPTKAKRENEINRLRRWIHSMEWPESVDAKELVELLDITGLGFADRIIKERQIRQAAWQNLIKADLFMAN